MPIPRLFLAILAAIALAAAQAQTPATLLDRAIAEQSGGNYTAAIRDYRQFLTTHPAAIEAHVNLGAALAHTGQFDSAIEQYHAALASLPKSGASPNTGEPETIALRQNLQLNLALAYYKKGDLPAARAQFQPLQQAQPDDPRLATLLGDTETRLGDPAAAITLMKPLAAANRENVDFQFAYGSALVRSAHQEQRREGAGILQQVADQGHSADAYMLTGSTLLDLNEYERGRQDLEQALRLNPKLPGLNSLVGVARDRTGATAEAEPAFREAIRQNPNDFNANLYLGTILLKQRRMDDARLYLDKAQALDPRSNMALYEGALLKSTAGDPQGAVAQLEKVTAADPNWLEPHVQLAALYYRLHQPEQGAKERATVDRLTAAQQSNGPGARP